MTEKTKRTTVADMRKVVAGLEDRLVDVNDELVMENNRLDMIILANYVSTSPSEKRLIRDGEFRQALDSLMAETAAAHGRPIREMIEAKFEALK